MGKSDKKTNKNDPPQIIHTIGHSTRELEDFLHILKSYKIKQLVDVRTMPGSRRVPQFNLENLKPALEDEGISYLHLKKLGGLRSTNKSSINTGWRNKSFRGFADYMQTQEFEEGLEELVPLAKESSTVIMCAEAVPWRCHRSMIGDALLVRGFDVEDIFSEKKQEPHTLTSFAKVDELKITYP